MNSLTTVNVPRLFRIDNVMYHKVRSLHGDLHFIVPYVHRCENPLGNTQAVVCTQPARAAYGPI